MRYDDAGKEVTEIAIASRAFAAQHGRMIFLPFILRITTADGSEHQVEVASVERVLEWLDDLRPPVVDFHAADGEESALPALIAKAERLH